MVAAPTTVLGVRDRILSTLLVACLTFGALVLVDPMRLYDKFSGPEYPKHPTLPFEAQIAECDWRVWFDGGSRPAYVAALNKFSEVSGIQWVEVKNDWEARVMVYTLTEKYNAHILGTAYRDPNLRWRSTIRLNADMLPEETDLARVTLHEVLHVFGLYHNKDERSLMHEYYSPAAYLTDEDIERIKMLAGTC